MTEHEAPRRVQLSRKKGWRLPENTVSVTRPGPFGNRYRIEREGPGLYRVRDLISGDSVVGFDLAGARHCAAAAFAHALTPQAIEAAKPRLRGKNLACTCPLDAECHADVWLEVVNMPELSCPHRDDEACSVCAELGTLAERLTAAIVRLDDLCNRAAYLHTTTEFARLDGKREGVKLALSYLSEARR